jgi:heme a synthase
MQRQRLAGGWLLFSAFLIFCMVLVGGATRLTESGLSITEWKPLSGALPPLSADAWQAEFLKYKQIPQYQLVNKGMSLDAFKTIYWWEWGHRQLGRFTGLSLALPFAFFCVRGGLCKPQLRLYGALVALVAAQGVMGWVMVASGLGGQMVSVAPLRLAMHLCLALVLLWGCVRVGVAWRYATWKRLDAPPRGFVYALTAAVFLAAFWGGLVAGHDAGLLYNSFPTFNGAWLPAELTSLASFGVEPGAIQLAHRVLGLTVLALAFACAWRWLPFGGTLRLLGLVCAGMAATQAAMGIATLLHQVPFSLALAHQSMAALLVAFTALLAAYVRPAGQV